MKKDFFDDEFVVIDIESKKFASYQDRQLVEEGVPCVVVRGEDGIVRFAHNGVVDSSELRQIERQVKRAYYCFPS
jgi:predicted transcriptional regulator